MWKFLAILAVSFSLSACESPYGKLIEERPAPLSPAEEATAKKAVAERLIDPDSASFRNIRGKNLSFDSGTVLKQVCGEINSKNRMGGFSGYSFFHGTFDAQGAFTLYNIDPAVGGDLTTMRSYYACR